MSRILQHTLLTHCQSVDLLLMMILTDSNDKYLSYQSIMSAMLWMNERQSIITLMSGVMKGTSVNITLQILVSETT